ncbi:MAG TPA: 30S ribosomal protein S6 [Vicinamibacterales bacterium]
MSAPRQYELVYIIAPDATDEQVEAVHQQVESTVQRLGGTLEKTDNWGRRKLAYEINHHKEGIYVLEVISGSGELMKELDRRLKVIDEVIRHLIVRVDEEQRVVERTRARRQETQARRRVARGLPPEPQEGEARPEGEESEGGAESAEAEA